MARQKYIENQNKAIERKQKNPEDKEILWKVYLKINKLFKNKSEFLNDTKERKSIQDLRRNIQ